MGTHLHQDTSNQGPVEVAEVKVAMVTEGEARGGGAVQQATAVQYLASHSNDDLLESALCHRKTWRVGAASSTMTVSLIRFATESFCASPKIVCKRVTRFYYISRPIRY